MPTAQALRMHDVADDERTAQFDDATEVESGPPTFELGPNDQPHVPLRLEATEPTEEPKSPAGTPGGDRPRPKTQKTPTPFVSRTIGELVTKEWAEPTALVTDPRGRLLVAATDPLLIHGDWRSGKTWLMLDLGISLASGYPLFDHFPVSEPKSVLYVGAEGTPGSFADRLDQLLQIRGMGRDDFRKRFRFIIMGEQRGDTSLFLDDGNSVDGLIEYLRSDPPDVIMIDPLASFMLGEETNDGMKLVVQEMRRITRSIGSQVFIAHHNVKNSEAYNKPSKMARGGGALAAGMGVVSLESEQKDDGWSIKVRNNPKEGAPIPEFEVRWITADDETSGRPRLIKVEIDTGDDRILSTAQWKILNALAGEAEREPITSIIALERLTDLPHSTAGRAVKELRELNLLEKDPDAGYRAKPKTKRQTGGWRVAYGGSRDGEDASQTAYDTGDNP